MTRLIDADHLKWNIGGIKCGTMTVHYLNWVIDNEEPTVEVEPHWIPCSEKLPEDLEEVNVTLINHNPEPYYNFVKDKPFTATAVYCKGRWYWYSSTCTDLLAEYGHNEFDEVDDGIDIVAWMPLPKPWEEVKE